METTTLLVNVKDGTMNITLNRPDSLNAMNKDMINELKNVLYEAENDPSVRVVTIKGSGRAFCAGGDIKGMGNKQGVEVYDHHENVNKMILAIRNLTKPVVALVHGYAAGIGFSLALACDLIIAEENTKFIMSFSKVGLVSDGGGAYLLTKLVGAQRAKELLFLAEPIDAQKAFELGIVNRIYSSEEMEEKSSKFVEQLTQGPSRSFEMIKKLVNKSNTASLEEIIQFESFMQTLMKSTNDHAEGIQAFKEKRQPNFTGS